jgi:hypothetical protein
VTPPVITTLRSALRARSVVLRAASVMPSAAFVIPSAARDLALYRKGREARSSGSDSVLVSAVSVILSEAKNLAWRRPRSNGRSQRSDSDGSTAAPGNVIREAAGFNPQSKTATTADTVLTSPCTGRCRARRREAWPQGSGPL